VAAWCRMEYPFFYSGGNKQEKGVGVLLSQEVSKAMLSWEPVISDRIITM